MICGLAIEYQKKTWQGGNQPIPAHGYVSIRYPDIPQRYQTTFYQDGEKRRVTGTNPDWRRFRVHHNCLPEMVDLDVLSCSSVSMGYFSREFYLKAFKDVPVSTIIQMNGQDVGYRTSSKTVCLKRTFYDQHFHPRLLVALNAAKEITSIIQREENNE